MHQLACFGLTCAMEVSNASLGGEKSCICILEEASLGAPLCTSKMIVESERRVQCWAPIYASSKSPCALLRCFIELREESSVCRDPLHRHCLHHPTQRRCRECRQRVFQAPSQQGDHCPLVQMFSTLEKALRLSWGVGCCLRARKLNATQEGHLRRQIAIQDRWGICFAM